MNNRTIRIASVVIALIALGACAKPEPVAAEGARPQQAAATSASGEQVVSLLVTSDGFVPASVEVKAGQPVKLVITRKTEQTCATEIVIKDYGIKRSLPLNTPVEVVFTPKKAGAIRYSCGMNMITGQIQVR